MKTVAYDNPSVGCYVDESAGSADDCNLRTIEFAEYYGFKAESIPQIDEGTPDPEILSEVADSAVEYLNSLETRPGYFWTFEDNSLFLWIDSFVGGAL